jgi:glycerol transport system ATP-binding protein
MDEPLANLDYKLREELRQELPRIFAQSGAIFVYATTEPSEALLLGGNTAALSEGRITQFGPTVEVYRHPLDLTTAKTFADPPLNFIDLVKSEGNFLRDGILIFAVPPHLQNVPNGPATIAFHPHHLAPTAQTADSARLTARTQISEITGSESFVHLQFADTRWVMLAHGIHNVDPDTDLSVFIDTRHLMAFGADGRAITTARQRG